MPRYEITMEYRAPIFVRQGVADRTVRVPTFTAHDMTVIGEAAIDLIKKHEAEGKDALGLPAKPLSKRYAARKVKKGMPAIRNMQYSGQMLSAMKVLSASEAEVKVGMGDSTAYKKAFINQSIDPWFGLSKDEQAHLVSDTARPLYAKTLEDALK